MNARRLAEQRRESAKSNAAHTLPSTQEKEFNLRLIDLYAEHKCLWDVSLKEYEDMKLRRQAWQDISDKMGTYLTPSFVRSRICNMRHRLNVYKMLMLDHMVNPASGKEPEKLYFIDKFAFLDDANNAQQQQEMQPQHSDGDQPDDGKDLGAKSSNLSIASIFKQRIQKQQIDDLPILMEHLTFNGRKPPQFNSVSVLSSRRSLKEEQEEQQQKQPIGEQVFDAIKKEIKNPDRFLEQRRHRLSLVEARPAESLADRMESISAARAALINIPSVVRKRMQHVELLPIGIQRILEEKKDIPQMPASMMCLPTLSSIMRGPPNDPISITEVTKPLGEPSRTESEEPLAISEDEDLYRLHYTVRQQQSTRRPSGNAANRVFLPQPVPSLNQLGMPSSPSRSSSPI